MKVEELREQNYLLTPKVASCDVKLLWHCDYWDGPRSGMLIYQGQPYWFQACDEDSVDFYRRFIIVQLSDEQLWDEQYWHELFRQKVGIHTGYDDNEESNRRKRPSQLL